MDSGQDRVQDKTHEKEELCSTPPTILSVGRYPYPTGFQTPDAWLRDCVADWVIECAPNCLHARVYTSVRAAGAASPSNRVT